MAGYGAYTTNQLGKTKMDDAEQLYYQQPAKKSKVEYMETGTWQQPVDTGAYTTDYSSYYSMYTDPTQQPTHQLQSQQLQPQHLQQQQSQQSSVSSYSQATYEHNQYSSYPSYSSYYNQPQDTASTPPATYECPLYEKSTASNYYGNGQAGSYHSSGYMTGTGSGYGQTRNPSFNNNNTTSANNYRSITGRSNDRNAGSSIRGGGGNIRGRNTTVNSNRGSSSDPRFRGSGRGVNRGYKEDESEYSDTVGRFASYNNNSRAKLGSLGGRGGRGGVAAIGTGRGAPRGRGRGRGATNNGAPGADGKWETLPGGQTRTKEKKPTAKAAAVDASKLPLPEKISKLSTFLRNEKREVNEIMLLENSIMSCKLGIKPDFLIDDMIQGKNGSFFTGRLIFEGIFLARHIASNKKIIKLTCYKKAVEMFRTMTPEQIMSGNDISTEELKQKLENLNSTVAKVEKDTIAEMPTVDVLKKLQEILKNPKFTPSNAISNLEQAVAVAKCRVRCRYDVEQGQSATGRNYFKGQYYIDNVIHGLGISISKKTAKANCYNMVVQRLMTCKAEDIVGGLDPSIEEKAVADLNASMKIVPKSAKNLDLREKFVRLKELLAVSDFTPDIISAMDLMFNDVKLTPVCLYRQGPKQENNPQKQVLLCNLYLAGRLMAVGEADNRKDAHLDAYKKSKDILLSSEPDFVLTQHSKLTPQDQAAPDVIDFRVKGNCVMKNNCTNIHRLQRTKLKVSDTPVKDIVIYEHATWSTDRKTQGFCILEHSCFLNNMLLEWEFDDDSNSTLFRCDMKIQKENVATQPAKCVNKIGSRNLAAADILFKLYETQPVIQITTYTKLDENTKCISFDDVLDSAIDLYNAAKAAGEEVEVAPPEALEKPDPEVKKETGVETDSDIKTENKDDDVEMKEEGIDDRRQPPRKRRPFKYMIKFILQNIKQRMEEFTKTKTLEDLLFGPSYPHQIARQIGGILRNSEVPVRFMSRAIRGSMYTIVTQSMKPKEMAEFLQENGGISGRFRLVDKSELPTHEDIMPELSSGEIKLSRHGRSGDQDNFFKDVSMESNSAFHTAMSSTLDDNSAYQSTLDTTLTSPNTSIITPKKEDASLPSTPVQGNTSTPKQVKTSTPVQKNTRSSAKKKL